MFSRKLASRSLSHPEEYWGAAARHLRFTKPFTSVVPVAPHTGMRPGYAPGEHKSWFHGGELNLCDNAVDRHVEEGFGNQTALMYDSPMSSTVQPVTYLDMQHQTSAIAHALEKIGVGKGDRVIVYMPMIPEAIATMLACARLGAVHSVVFGGFAAPELAKRIIDADPVAVVCASCGLEPNRQINYKELVDDALNRIEAMKKEPGHEHICLNLKHVLVNQRSVGPKVELTRPRDVDWDEVVHGAMSRSVLPCVPVPSNHPAFILYTSGTTGIPKGIVRDVGGYAVMMHATMSSIYGLQPGMTMFTASDIGWVVGHSYVVYAPLIKRCTSILYEGKPVNTPDAGAFWRVISQHQAQVMFTAPTAFRAIKQFDPEMKLKEGYDVSCLKRLYLAGERSDTDTLHWAAKHLDVPVIDHYWQTETAASITAAPALAGGNEKESEFDVEVRFGSAGTAAPGWDLEIVDQKNNPVTKPGTLGRLMAKLPLPPGTLTSIYNKPNGFETIYCSNRPGYYDTYDAGIIDEDGFVHILARTDDIINVAGHRLSTGQMEEVVSKHPMVAECAVVGAHCEVKGHKPVGLVVLKNQAGHHHGEEWAKAVETEIEESVKEEIGRIAAIRVHIVAKLPKTRSGKIVRKVIRQILDGSSALTVPPTIEDHAAVEDLIKMFKSHK